MDHDAPVTLSALLALEQTGPDRYVARHNERNAGGEVFGGQYLGQALWAALASGNERVPHAMTGWFLGSASAAGILEYRVERVRDGRHFGHRRVTATQDERVVFSADVSLREPLPGPTHQVPMPSATPPEACPTLAELLQRHGDTLGARAHAQIGPKRLVELRPVDARAGILERGIQPAAQIWLRVLHLGDTDRAMRHAMLAYLSDYWINAPSRMLHGRTLFSGDVTSVSLNHGLWFHREADVSGSLLYVVDSPSTHGGTGFNRGAVYHRDGRQLASTTQEAVVRDRTPPAAAAFDPVGS